jgi:hypothetical protein
MASDPQGFEAFFMAALYARDSPTREVAAES